MEGGSRGGDPAPQQPGASVALEKESEANQILAAPIGTKTDADSDEMNAVERPALSHGAPVKIVSQEPPSARHRPLATPPWLRWVQIPERPREFLS